MSIYTKKNLRKLFVYQVYIRNHTEEGTFQAFCKDLNRIKELGVDVVYLMPIHEIGQKKRKGNLGSPYSIKDFNSINHEYGTLDDFKDLVNKIHDLDMKLMIDIVFNHTSYDSLLIEKHPEYFYKENGEFKNRVGDWWDITDLDYTVSKDFWQTQIDTLLYWTKLGVDGFRWDVANIIPYQFLEEAHERVLEVNEDSIFLSETTHGHFTVEMRNRGFSALSESQIYEIFDIAYDYDTHPYFEGYLKGNNSFQRYLEELKRQEEVYPDNYIKLRNLENHDFGRFAPMVNNNIDKVQNWTALSFFLKGCTMMYSGQEKLDKNKPSLFEKDLVNWNGFDISSLVLRVSKLVKDDAFTYGNYSIRITDKDLYIGEYSYNNERFIGIFNIGLEEGNFDISLPDGTYHNLLNNDQINVKNNMMILSKNPIIIKVAK